MRPGGRWATSAKSHRYYGHRSEGRGLAFRGGASLRYFSARSLRVFAPACQVI